MQPGQQGVPPSFVQRPQGAPQPSSYNQPGAGRPLQPVYGQPAGTPYANGPSAVQPPGPAPGALPQQPTPQSLAGQMQQMQLGQRPPAAGVAGSAPRPAVAPPPAAGPGGPRPMPAAQVGAGYAAARPQAVDGAQPHYGPPGAVQPPGAPRPAGAVHLARPGMPGAPAGHTSLPNGHITGAPSAGAAATAPGTTYLARPPVPAATAPAPMQPPHLQQQQQPFSGVAAGPRPAAGPLPSGLLAPRPAGFGGPASAAGSGPSTPSKAQQQQQPGFRQQQAAPTSPPPYALQMASPSPTKAGQAGVARPAMGVQPPPGPVGGLRPPAAPGLGAGYAPGPPLGVGQGLVPPQQPGLARQYPPQPRPPGAYPQPGPAGMQPPMPSAPSMPPHAAAQYPGSLHPPHAGMAGPMGAPLQQQPPASSAASKIDPAQIPRPSSAAPATQVFETRRENTHAVPPSADAPVVVKDRGSAGPRYMRSSLNMVPQSADLLKNAALPFVAIINPLALPEPQDDQIQVVDFGEGGPVRCGDCKAYVNPYTRFVDGGRRMQCNFCGSVTDVPPDYVCPLGPDGQRADRHERPELCMGSVEIVAPGPYMVRPPMPPVHFFLIDVSQPAIASGATAAVCSSLARVLEEELPGGDRTQVCIATFDSTIHYYSMRPHQAQPQMLVVPDVTDVYCPLSGNVVVSLAQSRSLVSALLENIPRMFAGTQIAESCSGAAIKSAVEALKGGVGGRLHAFVSSLPRKGVLSLRPRDLGRPPTDRDNLDNMLPENKEYAALAADAAENQVSIDLFFLSQGYVDVATMGVLSTATCGSLYHYAPFSPAVDADELFNDLRWNLLRPQGLEAVARLRVSKGLAVDRYLGSFHRRTPTDLDFPALSCDHALAAKIVHEEKLPEHGEVYLQYALLYSTLQGQRRVRVHTLALPITQSLGTTFRGADLDSYLSYVARKVSSQIPGHALAACKEAVIKASIDALLAYRKQCASASSSGQLILPEALKLLPLYTLALTKAPPFRPETHLDARALWIVRLLSLPASRLVPLIYGRLLPLHPGLLGRPASAPPLPDKLWLSAEKLEPEGAYLLENGWQAFVYLGKALPPQACTELLGVPSLDHLPSDGTPLQLPRLDTPLSRAVHALLDEVRRQRCTYLRLRLLRRGDPLEPAFYHALVEDRSPTAGMSYVEFLCFAHRQIQNKLS